MAVLRLAGFSQSPSVSTGKESPECLLPSCTVMGLAMSRNYPIIADHFTCSQQSLAGFGYCSCFLSLSYNTGNYKRLQLQSSNAILRANLDIIIGPSRMRSLNFVTNSRCLPELHSLGLACRSKDHQIFSYVSFALA